MTTKILTGTYAAGYTLQSPLTALTVAASGYVEGTGLATASTAAGAYSVVNLGRVVSAAASDGVYLAAGGSVTNGGKTHLQARIDGYSGIDVASGLGDIDNFGTIQGQSATPSHAGIDLNGGGRITNGNAADTTASVIGQDIAVDVANAAGTVTNFGTIKAANSSTYQSFAVFLGDGGTITNGANADTTALIQAQNGVYVYGVGKVTNFGTIDGTGDLVGDVSVVLSQGGNLINGSLTDANARIEGYGGLNVGNGSISNFGVVISTGRSGEGVLIDYGGGAVTNGAAGHAGALIEGSYGVVAYGYKGDPAVVTNFGTIEGSGGAAVYFLNQYSVLNVEAGSTFVGAIMGDGGTLDLASGVGTLSGLSAASVTVSGSMAATTFQAFGTVQIGSGAAFTDADASSAIGAGDSLVDDGRLTLSGAIANAGQIDLNAATLIVGTAGLSLTGAGTMLMSNSAANVIEGASAAATLTNRAKIQGAGQLGDGTMTLDNAAGALIEGTGAVALTINTGAGDAIVNAGTIEADGTGGVKISSPLDNNGLLITSAGTLDVLGAVTGKGAVKIDGGTAEFAGAFGEKVAFTGSSGILELSQADSAAITGFSKTGATSIDLLDIAFAGTTTGAYAGTKTSGVLTVTEGSKSATLHLVGDYLGSSFTLSAGPGGVGTVVVAKASPSATPATTHPFVGAMAGFGAPAGGSVGMGAEPWRTPQTMLAGPRALA